MATKVECPDDAEMRRLANHGGEPEEIDRLARHLEVCEPCGLAIETMLGANDTLDALRAAPAMPSGPDVDKAKEAVRQLRPAAMEALQNSATIGTKPTFSASNVSAKSGTATEGSFEYLAPPEQAGELGRLGQFRILKKLGSGGMGIVFLAEDTALDRKVALKTLLPKIAADPTACERFLREARSAASIEHEHIVIIHHVGVDRGLPFIAMPLLRGESLEDRIKKKPPISLKQSLIIARQVAAGLQAAHAKGLIHRDIKPGNVWLDSDTKKVKILDFGLARAATDTANLTQSGAIVGTPAYMAPEQARGVKVDGRADLFSLGCILYEMLTGKRPFTGKDTMSILTSLALDTPTPPAEVNPDVPASVSDIAMKLLAKNPDERFTTAAEAAEALRGIVAQPSGSPPATTKHAEARAKAASPVKRTEAQKPSGPAARPASRRRVPIMVGTMLGLILLGAGAFFFSGTVIRIATNKGQLVIENFGDNGDVEIKITRLGGNPQVQIVDRESKRTIDLEAGDYAIDVKEKDGFAFQTDTFTLTRGGVERVRVKLEPGIAQNTGKNAPTLSQPILTALEFNGVDSCVEVPSLRFDGSHPLTIEARLKFDDLDRMTRIAGWGGVSSLFSINSSQLGFNGFAQNNTNVGSLILLGSSVKTKFIHVAGVYDGTSVRVYNNGVAAQAYACPRIRDAAIPGGLSVDNFAIGCEVHIAQQLNRQKSEFFKGVIDEVRISKVARYTDSFLPPVGPFKSDNDTMALYRFDEGQGTIARDSSSNKHDGKIIGAKWLTISPDGASISVVNPAVSPKPAVVPFSATEAVRSQEAWAKHLGVPVEIATSPSIKLRLIPPGEFETGFTRAEAEAILAEWKEKKISQPFSDQIYNMVGRHRIRLTKPFYLATHEFSRKDYLDLGQPAPVGNVDRENGAPISHITWLEAVETCNRLSKKNDLPPYYAIEGQTVVIRGGSGFRLPTSAEWEFAYSAGADPKSAYPWGPAAEIDKHAWYAGNSGKLLRASGQKTANPFGLFDLAGNAWEWCFDFIEPYSARGNTVDDPMGPQSHAQKYRVLRSTSFGEPLETLAPWYFFAYRQDGFLVTGLRVARDVVPSVTPKPAVVPFTAAEAVRSQEAWAKHLGVPVEAVTSPTIKLRLIPAGEFETGLTRDEVEVIRDEWKDKKVVKANTDQLDNMIGRHRIRLTKPFYLATTEFSRANYLDLHPDKGNRQEYGEPVNVISWLDAVDTCNRLSKKHGLSPYYTIDGETVRIRGGSGFRLPTSAEWEFAYRAGVEKTAYPWGPAADVGKHAWYAGNTEPQQARPCGAKAANPFGLIDMSGNVREWCYDYHEPYSQRAATTVDPMGSSTHSLRYRVLRGGSYVEPLETLAPWFFFAFQEQGVTISGFRVARDVPISLEKVAPVTVNNTLTPQIPEPPPLAEWLKGRTVLTVSQDGKGQYKTIQAALDALKPGQVVKVLDRGPYRESLETKEMPRDVGLVSEVQSIIEVASWRHLKSGKFNHQQGHILEKAQGLRISGFELRASPVPADNVVTILHVVGSRGVLVEDCKIHFTEVPPSRYINLLAVSVVGFGGDPRVPTVVRDCVIDGRVDMNGPPELKGAPVLITRCLVNPKTGHAAILVQGKLQRVSVDSNVLVASPPTNGIILNPSSNIDGLESIDISKNTVVGTGTNGLKGPPGGDITIPNSTRVSIRDNVMTALRLRFGPRTILADESAKKKWQVSGNWYLLPVETDPTPGDFLFRRPDDPAVSPQFLSQDPAARDFARLTPIPGVRAAGALPPGPAPKEGDWFTRLRERWTENAAKSGAKVAPVSIPEPPPLADWLKGRTVLTVSQDGKGQYKTIQAALDALQPGQVVKVLDRGPYRETLSLKKPTLNVGLVSEVQTVLEVAELSGAHKYGKDGHQLRDADHFRLAGFAFTYNEDPEAWVHVLRVDSHGVVVENCSFARRTGSLPGKGAVAIDGIWSEEKGVPSCTVRDCRIVDATVTFQGKEGANASVLVQNCYLSGSSHMVLEGFMRRAIVRHNVIEGVNHGIQFVRLTDVELVQVNNNTIPRASGGNSFWPKAPNKGVVIRNNILKQTDRLGLGQNASELSLEGMNWQVGNNAYLAGGEQAQALTRQPGDILAPANLFSRDPSDRDYLRIAADTPAATGGTGGAWPSYIGALPPGPAPKDGDWFTRLRERWADVPPGK